MDIPRHGEQKINAAYAFGGPALAIQTVEQVTGIPVNHVVVVDFTTLSDTDRSALRRRLQDQIPPAECFSGTRVFAVASGKGGVGKSSVSVNLAVAMARQGKRVAILDADVYGFSVPRMLGIDRTPLVIDSLLIPPEAEGVSVVSVGFFVDEGTPVIWRGPMLHKMLQQFINDVWWGRPDVLLIDMPPGTGDVSLTLSELLPTAGAKSGTSVPLLDSASGIRTLVEFEDEAVVEHLLAPLVEIVAQPGAGALRAAGAACRSRAGTLA